MKYFVISHNRPDAPKKMAQFLKDIEPTWILGKNEKTDEYKYNGAHSILEGYSLMEARNLALDLAFKDNEPCMQISDDVGAEKLFIFRDEDYVKSNIEANRRGKKILGVTWNVVKEKEKATFGEIGQELLAKLSSTPYKLAGILPTHHHYSATQKVRFSVFILGDCFVCLPTHLRFDTNLSLKEDYDFTLQHIKEYGGAVRCDYCFACFYHKQKGGVSNLRNLEKEQENIDYLKQKWGKLISDNKNREGEIKLNRSFMPFLKKGIIHKYGEQASLF